MELGHVGHLVVFLIRGVGLRGEALAQHGDGQDDAHHAKRIGDGRAQRHLRDGEGVGRVDLQDGLLGGSQGGRVGDGSTQDAAQDGDRQPRGVMQQHDAEQAQQGDAQAHHVEGDASLLQRPEEAGAHLEP